MSKPRTKNLDEIRAPKGATGFCLVKKDGKAWTKCARTDGEDGATTYFPAETSPVDAAAKYGPGTFRAVWVEKKEKKS